MRHAHALTKSDYFMVRKVQPLQTFLSCFLECQSEEEEKNTVNVLFKTGLLCLKSDTAVSKPTPTRPTHVFNRQSFSQV